MVDPECHSHTTVGCILFEGENELMTDRCMPAICLIAQLMSAVTEKRIKVQIAIEDPITVYKAACCLTHCQYMESKAFIAIV